MIEIKKMRHQSKPERLHSHSRKIQNHLNGWLEYMDDPNMGHPTYRSIYQTLHDLTSSAKEYWSGQASEQIITYLITGKIGYPSYDHFYGGKKFSVELMQYVVDNKCVPELNYIKEHIMRKGGCNWVTKEENKILGDNDQDYTLISPLKEHGAMGEYFLKDGSIYVPAGTLEGF